MLCSQGKSPSQQLEELHKRRTELLSQLNTIKHQTKSSSSAGSPPKSLCHQASPPPLPQQPIHTTGMDRTTVTYTNSVGSTHATYSTPGMHLVETEVNTGPYTAPDAINVNTLQGFTALAGTGENEMQYIMNSDKVT